VFPFVVQSWFAAALSLVLLALKAFCLVDALVRPAETFVAADKNTKQLWLVILALAVAGSLFIPGAISLINIIGIVAALVYLLDVRPAVRELTRPR
jgi:hypothetical protein